MEPQIPGFQLSFGQRGDDSDRPENHLAIQGEGTGDHEPFAPYSDGRANPTIESIHHGMGQLFPAGIDEEPL
jgi:hypothetical protein